MFSYSLILCFIAAIINCYPLFENEFKPLAKDEKTLANGTVVGKYSYFDHEGNTVQVHYFADNTSYGVELKSLKVVGDPEQLAFSQQPKLDFPSADPSPALPLEQENIESSNFNKFKYNIPKDFFDNVKKEGKSAESNSLNDLKARRVKKCRKDKARSIFYNKSARKIRRALDTYKNSMPGVCAQF